MFRKVLFTAFVVLFTMTDHSQCAEGTRIIKEKCEACHAFVKPEKSDLSRFLNRKGQDLYWSGSKYRQA